MIATTRPGPGGPGVEARRQAWLGKRETNELSSAARVAAARARGGGGAPAVCGRAVDDSVAVVVEAVARLGLVAALADLTRARNRGAAPAGRAIRHSHADAAAHAPGSPRVVRLLHRPAEARLAVGVVRAHASEVTARVGHHGADGLAARQPIVAVAVVAAALPRGASMAGRATAGNRQRHHDEERAQSRPILSATKLPRPISRQPLETLDFPTAS